MNEFNIAVGKRIRALREKYGYTREKLAERADMNCKFLYEVEVGKKGLSALKMKKLAAALGVDMDFLASGEKEEREYGVIVSMLSCFTEQEIKDIENIIRSVLEISRRSAE